MYRDSARRRVRVCESGYGVALEQTGDGVEYGRTKEAEALTSDSTPAPHGSGAPTPLGRQILGGIANSYFYRIFEIKVYIPLIFFHVYWPFS